MIQESGLSSLLAPPAPAFAHGTIFALSNWKLFEPLYLLEKVGQGKT